MKIARIVLTATILLSLKSTFFCSSENNITHELPRTSSFDCLTDGSILLTIKDKGDWQMKNYDTQHKGKTVRIESRDPERAKRNYESYGKTITDITMAEKFEEVIIRSQLPISQEAHNASQNLIAAKNKRIEEEKQAKVQANMDKFVTINQECKGIAQNLYVERNVERPKNHQDITKKHNAACKAERIAYDAQCHEKDLESLIKLNTNLTQLIALRQSHNTEFPQNPITKKLFTENKSEIIQSDLKSLTIKYQDWKKKNFANISAEAQK